MLISRVNIFDIREQRSRINPVCCNEIVGGKRGMGIETESGTEVNMQLGSNLRFRSFIIKNRISCSIRANELRTRFEPQLSRAKCMNSSSAPCPMNALDTPRKDKYSNMHNSHGTRELCWRTQLFLVFLPDGGCFWFPFKYSSFR